MFQFSGFFPKKQYYSKNGFFVHSFTNTFTILLCVDSNIVQVLFLTIFHISQGVEQSCVFVEKNPVCTILNNTEALACQ